MVTDSGLRRRPDWGKTFCYRARRLLTVLLGLTWFSPAFGAGKPGEAWTFTFYEENDLFAATDGYYTNGTKLTWISPDLSSFAESRHLPPWSLDFIRWLPFINQPGLQRSVAVSIGQSMFTPSDIAGAELIREDRPYAGWTYLGMAFHSKSLTRMDAIEIQLGMVGPASLSELTQKTVHKLGGFPEPKGWDHQLRNEPGLNAIYERRERLWYVGPPGGLAFDALGHLGGALGNVSTFLSLGLQFRVGWNIPADFGTSLIRPAGDTNAPLSPEDPRLSRRSGFGLHAFTLFDGRVVARNIFLDGNTFADSHRVHKKPFVGDVAAGLSLVLRWFKITYAHVLRSEEFDGQPDKHFYRLGQPVFLLLKPAAIEPESTGRQCGFDLQSKQRSLIIPQIARIEAAGLLVPADACVGNVSLGCAFGSTMWVEKLGVTKGYA